ncbi:hypothetical protein ACWF0M_09095 [Kribbella sp. NPDC055110]
MLIVGGYVVAAPTTIGPPELPRPLRTISTCLLETFSRPIEGDWYVERTEAERAVSGSTEVITVAFDDELAAGFRSEFEETDDFFSLLDEGRPLDVPVLGYEVVGLERSLTFHSWHCHGFAGQVHHELGIGIDESGLLGSPEDGRQVLEYLRTRPAWDAPYQIPWTVVALAATAASGTRSAG